MAPVKVAVTGAAGQIAYAFLPTLCRGLIFGDKQPIVLHLLDIPPMLGALNGVVMELQDCAFPLVENIIATADPKEAFDGIDYCVMLGAMPRKEGMQRKDLLKANVSIFKDQGEALDQVAKKDVKVVVVGNPANTNALICSHFAKSIPKENFTALTRLDELRAKSMAAIKTSQNVSAVKKVIIWGNHSNTQYPDLTASNVAGKIDDAWRKGEFVQTVSSRGAAIIKARKLSSAMSAANAVAEHLKTWHHGTPSDDWISMGVISDNNPYDVASGLIFSFPVQISNKQWRIAEGVQVDAFSREMIDKTTKELMEEREEAMVHLTGSKM